MSIGPSFPASDFLDCFADCSSSLVSEVAVRPSFPGRSAAGLVSHPVNLFVALAEAAVDCVESCKEPGREADTAGWSFGTARGDNTRLVSAGEAGCNPEAEAPVEVSDVQMLNTEEQRETALVKR